MDFLVTWKKKTKHTPTVLFSALQAAKWLKNEIKMGKQGNKKRRTVYTPVLTLSPSLVDWTFVVSLGNSMGNQCLLYTPVQKLSNCHSMKKIHFCDCIFFFFFFGTHSLFLCNCLQYRRKWLQTRLGNQVPEI